MSTKESINHSENPLDLLVIGTSQEIHFRELMDLFPDIRGRYIDAEETSLEDLGIIFKNRTPKRTLIYGELSKTSGKLGELNLNILKLFVELKQPGQKIFIAAYFEFPNHLKHLKIHHLRMPSSPINIMKKFDQPE